MSTYKDDSPILIMGLQTLLMNSWKVAQESYCKEGNDEFNTLMTATVRPTEILCELIESQKSTNEYFKRVAFLKAQRELSEELKKRIANSLPIKKGARA